MLLPAAQQRGRHLVVVQHGLWGTPADTAQLAWQLQQAGFLVLNAGCNFTRLTFEGVDVCGDRWVQSLHSNCVVSSIGASGPLWGAPGQGESIGRLR